MNIISRTDFRNRKESIFEPRPYEYQKKIRDTSVSSNFLGSNQNSYHYYRFYVLHFIKIICIIFSLIQIFIAGLHMISNNSYSNLSDFMAFIYGSYISVLHFLENYFD